MKRDVVRGTYCMGNWFRSLRIRLQIWHALILLFVVLGFGFLFYDQSVRSRWYDVDSQLISAGRILEGALRRVPLPILDSLAQDIGRNRPPPRPDGSGRGLPGRGPRTASGDRVPPSAPPPQGNAYRPPKGVIPPGRARLDWDNLLEQAADSTIEWEKQLVLPRSLPEQLGRPEERPYFIIWRRDGSVLREADVPYQDRQRPNLNQNELLLESSGDREKGPVREILLRGPEDTLICVGRNVRSEMARMYQSAINIVLVGVSILAVGLCGGWWLSGRAIKPIKNMSETASAISATNLTQRMDLDGVDTELAQLGAVLNNMLERLDQAFATQQRFTADASHELRTPLAVMQTNIELALAKQRTPEEYREQLLKCQRATNRMSKLVESLLLLARTDGPSDPGTAEILAWHKITGEALDNLRVLADQHQIQLDSELGETYVKGRGSDLYQVITNLVINAIIYNQPHGRVHVSLKSSGSQAELIVSDTGIGIAPIDLPHIFERFFRSDTSRSRSSAESHTQVSGSGLGLAICQRIIINHGGTIRVESQLQHGSRFIVSLPLPPVTPLAM